MLYLSQLKHDLKIAFLGTMMEPVFQVKPAFLNRRFTALHLFLIRLLTYTLHVKNIVDSKQLCPFFIAFSPRLIAENT